MDRTIAVAFAAASLCATGGCVTVNAPDKPIVIDLNINITQEIVYKFDGDAKALIQSRSDIF